MLLIWRLRLRAKLRRAKQAKAAQKHLLLRRYLHIWTAKVAEKQRERKLEEFQRRVVKRSFYSQCICLSIGRVADLITYSMA